MTGAQALVLATIALAGGCSTLCPIADTTEVPELVDTAGEDTRRALDLEATVPAPPRDDLTGLLAEFTRTHLPGPGHRPALADPPSPREVRPLADGWADGSEVPPDREPDPVASHVPRTARTTPTAGESSSHAARAWPSAQGEPVTQQGAAIAASILLGLAAVGLYHKLTKERALDHPARRDILAMLESEPGLGTTAVADRLDVCYRTARHHLEVLARFDLVVRGETRGSWRWARPHDAEAVREPDVPELQKRVLGLLQEDPGLHLSEIARRLDVAKATVKLHLDRLDERGRVRDERVGPLRRFFPEESAST